MRAEGFSCSLDVVYGGLGISKLPFLIKKEKKISDVFFLQFLVIKTLDPDSLEMLDPDPYPNPDSMNPPDPQHWYSDNVIPVQNCC